MADTKIVYNACYGGFDLSHEAVMRYAELKGITLYPEDYKSWLTLYYTEPPSPSRDDNKACFSVDSIDRTDPILVRVVEELGDLANAPVAKLRVATLPKGTHYRIEEYDGFESIETDSDIQWNIA
jgi:hypothetical protein